MVHSCLCDFLTDGATGSASGNLFKIWSPDGCACKGACFAYPKLQSVQFLED